MIRKKISKDIKIRYDGNQYSIGIPIDIVKNLKIEEGDIFRFITNRKKRFQSFEIIKK